jgi:hypothetical protein
MKGACADYLGQCEMFCTSELDGCKKIGGRFRDGTPCGDGQCIAGKCSESNLIGDIAQWALDNQRLAMAIIIVAAVVLLCGGWYYLKTIRIDRNQAAIRKARLEQNELERLDKMERDKRRSDMKKRQEKPSGSQPADSKRNSRRTSKQ